VSVLMKKCVNAAAIALVLSPIYAYAAEESPNTDAAIAAAASAELKNHAALRADHLKVQSFNGVVYVYGTVDTGVEAHDAVEILSKLPQVKGVVDMTSSVNV